MILRLCEGIFFADFTFMQVIISGRANFLALIGDVMWFLCSFGESVYFLKSSMRLYYCVSCIWGIKLLSFQFILKDEAALCNSCPELYTLSSNLLGLYVVANSLRIQVSAAGQNLSHGKSVWDANQSCYFCPAYGLTAITVFLLRFSLSSLNHVLFCATCSCFIFEDSFCGLFRAISVLEYFEVLSVSMYGSEPSSNSFKCLSPSYCVWKNYCMWGSN